MKAYPYMHKHPTSGQTEIAAGMDLRDYFAAKAMQGMFCHDTSFAKQWQDQAAQDAYNMADAMMKQRQIKDVPNE